MKKFDKFIKRKAAEEPNEIPDFAKENIEQTLADLPEREYEYQAVKRTRILPRIATVAALFVFVTLILLPNISMTYVNALQDVPLIGDIVRVVTFRKYSYSDDHHEMDINVPKIETGENEIADCINKDVSELTTILVNQFYEDIEINGNNGYGSIQVDYNAITNTNRWFTLKISVLETAASSNTYYKFYHIDKKQGKIVELKDLFSGDEYSKILVDEIKRQMKKQMEDNESILYWINDEFIGEDPITVSPDHNFYINNKGDLVIVFDKYEVGPGSMGTPEFIIEKEIINDILKPEMRDVLS